LTEHGAIFRPAPFVRELPGQPGRIALCGAETAIAWALGHKACRDDRSALDQRLPLFDTLALARGDGHHARLLKSLARVELLILDDWGLAPMTAEQRRDLLEIMEDRHGRGSTMVTSQLPVEHWHEVIGDPTLADAILDRLVHTAHRLALKGESLRKAAAKHHKLDADLPTDLMKTSTRERAMGGGRDHRNPRPASIGTGGRLRSKSPADFVGMRNQALGKRRRAKGHQPEAALIGRKVMEWFNQKTSIAGVQTPNWGIVLGAVVVILLIYSSVH
jgi:IstB-like ATP binding protein